MMKYMNGQEISGSSSVKLRSHSAVTAEGFIDYLRLTAQEKTKMMVFHSDTNDI